MDAIILCNLLATRIPPEQFRLNGLEVVFIDPEINNKPVDSPNDSPYDTLENRAIVEEVIKNYAALETEYLAEQAKEKSVAKAKAKLIELDLKSIRSIREWLVAQPNAPSFIKDHETSAVAERAILTK